MSSETKIVEHPYTSMWDEPNRVITNPVNCVGVMGAGIALEFKRSFPLMYLLYRQVCSRKLMYPGDVLTYYAAGYTVVNVATKGHFKYNSKIQYIKDIVTNLNVVQTVVSGSIGMPKIGCGKGGLKWEDVSKELEKLNYEQVNVYTAPFLAEVVPENYFNPMLFVSRGQVHDVLTEEDYSAAINHFNTAYGKLQRDGGSLEAYLPSTPKGFSN